MEGTGGGGGRRPGRSPLELRALDEIPDALWPVYEAVAGAYVGIRCACGMDRTLNASGPLSCSGFIGRPSEAGYDGREAARCCVCPELDAFTTRMDRKT